MSEDPDGEKDGRDDERHAGGDRDDATGGGDGEPLSELAERIRGARSRREGEGRGEGGAESDPFAPLEREAEGERTGKGDESDPFAALEAETEGGDPTTSGVGETGEGTDGDPFDRMDVEAIDEEAVWESLEADDGEPIDASATDAGVEAERVKRDDPGAERPEHVVEKGAYCQRCRFLSAPPEVRCTHDGTEIVEVVDSERFRVRGCPMVARGGALARDPDDA